MEQSDRDDPRPEKPRSNGLGVLCREAQADGVPCADRGRECTECRRAVDPPKQEATGADEAESRPVDWGV